MLFNEPAFLFFFLPLVVLLHLLPWSRYRNALLLIASLFFFSWGEKIGILLGAIVINYFLGLWVGRTRGTLAGKWVIGAAVSTNIAILLWFKYAVFMGENWNAAMGLWGGPQLHLKQVALPLAISFIVFHGICYVMDIYRGFAPANKNILETALYLSFFPKLIAGPIMRYQDFADQYRSRKVDLEDVAYGVRRFIIGLAKKMLLAGTLAVPADHIFKLPTDQLTAGVAWLGILCYTLQIYIDFSAYSDMAIGIARIFGFRIFENFNYPYLSTTVIEFWKRWHISLGTWFRDYLFFPLGANYKGELRAYFNLVVVFFLCGLWHGASWTFAIWGLYHGLLMVIERVGFAPRLATAWKPVQHMYCLLALMVGWVIFRATSLDAALHYLGAMVGLAKGSGQEFQVAMYLDTRVGISIVLSIVASVPWLPALKKWVTKLPVHYPRHGELLRVGFVSASLVALGGLLLASAMFIAAGTYNPFIYARF